MHFFYILSVLSASCIASSSSSSSSTTNFNYRLNHFFDGSDTFIAVRYMPDNLDKEWFNRYFTAVKGAGHNLDAKIWGTMTLFDVAVRECNPRMVGALIELGVTIHPSTHVFDTKDRECQEVHEILTDVRTLRGQLPEEAGESSSGMEESYDDSEDDGAKEEGDGSQESQEEVDGAMEEDNQDISNEGSDENQREEDDSTDMNVQNALTAQHGDIDCEEILDILRAPIVEENPSSQQPAPYVQNLYQVRVPMRIEVAQPQHGVIYTPF